MHQLLQSILDYAAQHATQAIIIAFLISALEATLIVGIFIPSTVVLVGLGGIVGMGQLPFWPIFIATAVGAAIGDAVSFWIGHYYRERLYEVWPFSRYKNLLIKGRDYFAVHGGKSVVIGRFIPAIKAVVPGIAGMMGMSPVRFSVLNILSSFVWAAMHLLPGLSAGWALLLVASISKRLAITLAIILVLLILLLWLLRGAIGMLSLQLPLLQARVDLTLKRNPHLKSGWLGRLTLPEHASFRQEAVLYLLLALLSSGLLVIIGNVLLHTGLGGLDAALSEGLRGLRTPWSDVPMLSITMSGDGQVIVVVIVSILAVLAWSKRFKLLGGVALVLATASIFIFGLKGLLKIPRPTADLYSGVDAYSFPSGHAGFSTILAGLLIWFVAKGWRDSRRYVALLMLVALAALIDLSRIYLGAHWPSDILGSLLFGSSLIVGFALAFRQESVSSKLTRRVMTLAGVTYLGMTAFHIQQSWDANALKYKNQAPAPLALSTLWKEGGWKQLPTYRQDLYGELEEPFVLQWQGSLDQLQLALPDWRVAPTFTLKSLNSFASPDTQVTALPVFAKLMAGEGEKLALVKPTDTGRLVLRLYEFKIVDFDGMPATLWLGTFIQQELYHPFNQLSVLISDDERSCSVPALSKIPNVTQTSVTLEGAPTHSGCGGQLVLGSNP